MSLPLFSFVSYSWNDFVSGCWRSCFNDIKEHVGTVSLTWRIVQTTCWSRAWYLKRLNCCSYGYHRGDVFQSKNVFNHRYTFCFQRLDSCVSSPNDPKSITQLLSYYSFDIIHWCIIIYNIISLSLLHRLLFRYLGN